MIQQQCTALNCNRSVIQASIISQSEELPCPCLLTFVRLLVGRPTHNSTTEPRKATWRCGYLTKENGKNRYLPLERRYLGSKIYATTYHPPCHHRRTDRRRPSAAAAAAITMCECRGPSRTMALPYWSTSGRRRQTTPP